MSLSLNTQLNPNTQIQPPALGRPEQSDSAVAAAAHRSAAATSGSVTDLFKTRFADLAGDKAAFHALLKESFGPGYNAATAEAFRKSALAGDFSWLPAVAYVTDEKLGGALGAYDAVNNVVYLNRTLASDPSFAASIYVEEAGHFLDTALNTSDTAGDEGELFRRLLSGEKISAADRKAIAAENDFGTIVINGKEIQIEQWNPFKKAKAAAKKAAAAAKAAAKKAAAAVKAAAKKAAAAAKKATDVAIDKILAPAVKALVNTLGPIIEKLGKELAPLLALGGKVVELLQKTFGPLMQVVSDVLGPILKPIGKLMGSIDKAADKVLGRVLKPLREGVSNLIGRLIDGAKTAHVPSLDGKSVQSVESRNANLAVAKEQLGLAADELLSATNVGLIIIGGAAAVLGKVFKKVKNFFKKAPDLDAPNVGKSAKRNAGRFDADAAKAAKKADAAKAAKRKAGRFDPVDPGKKKVSFEPTDVRRNKRLKSQADRSDFAAKRRAKRQNVHHQGPRKNLGDGPATKKGVTSKRDIEAIRAKQAARRKGPVKTQADANRIAQQHHADLKADAIKSSHRKAGRYDNDAAKATRKADAAKRANTRRNAGEFQPVNPATKRTNGLKVTFNLPRGK